MTIEICCDDMARAFQDGTDNEGYGHLVWTKEFDTRLRIGCSVADLKPIKFCPWCGHQWGEEEGSDEYENEETSG